jgi:hypothetical protein
MEKSCEPPIHKRSVGFDILTVGERNSRAYDERITHMSGVRLELFDLDQRIEAARENLRELVQQAVTDTGGAVEEFISQRIFDQEGTLGALMRKRHELAERVPHRRRSASERRRTRALTRASD